MRVALAQYKFINKNIDFNFLQIKRALEKAKGKADIVCFGETFLQGFDALCWDYEKDKNVAITQDSDIMKKICELTTFTGVALVFGYIEKDGENGGKIYSSCAVIEKGKIIHNYRRISRGWKEFWKTDFHYSEGNEVEPFSYRGREFLLCLCGDMWDYPERFKTDCPVIWGVYVNFENAELAEFEKDYAKQVATVSDDVLMINSLSDFPDDVSHGGTFHFHLGEIKERCDYDKEELLIVEI